MKTLASVFALAALAGCSQPDEINMIRHMQTMLDEVPGAYTFMPNTDDSSYINVKNPDLWDLVIKLDGYDSIKGGEHFLCAHFKTVTVNMTPAGKYMLPYDRTVYFVGQTTGSAKQQFETPLPDFKIKTLLDLTENIPDKDRSTQPYKLISTVKEVCAHRLEHTPTQ